MPPILLHLPTHKMPIPTSGAQVHPASLFELNDLTVFSITGTDARTFIQGQVTNDIASTDAQQSRLAGYCTAQGRLLATMVLNPLPDMPDLSPTIQGLIKSDLAEPVIKRLGMFVLRAKAKLALTDHVVRGISATDEQLPSLQKTLGHNLPITAWQTRHGDTGTWICAPSRQEHRWWWITSKIPTGIHQKIITSCQKMASADWHALDIDSGIPWIELATQDLFIPQTLNLDLIEGVSFTKGCYPGQEIVARSHYRGTLKKRMALGQIDSASVATNTKEFKPGVDIYDLNHADQPCGRIINSASTAGVAHILCEVTFDAMDHGKLVAGGLDGPQIALRPLPYSIRPA